MQKNNIFDEKKQVFGTKMATFFVPNCHDFCAKMWKNMEKVGIPKGVIYAIQVANFGYRVMILVSNCHQNVVKMWSK